jgi:hypothetical protein
MEKPRAFNLSAVAGIVDHDRDLGLVFDLGDQPIQAIHEALAVGEVVVDADQKGISIGKFLRHFPSFG